MSSMVRIDEIMERSEVTVRQALREEAVADYMGFLDSMPPVDLMWVEDELVLTDGKHRVTAAKRLGRSAIAATTTVGTLEEAVFAAATANAKRGVPLNRDEQKTAILHLWRSDPAKTRNRRWSAPKIAAAVGLSESKVEHILQAEKVRSGIPPGAAGNLSDSHIEELGTVPEPMRQSVAKAAATGGWTHREVREVAKALADPGVPEESKVAAIRAIAQPDENGKAAIPQTFVMEYLNEARRYDALPKIYAFTSAAQGLLDALSRDTDPLGEVSAGDRSRIEQGLEAAELATAKVTGLLEQQKVKVLA